MTVKFYQFGKLVGGTDSGGGTSVPSEASYGDPEMFNGTLGAAVTTITFARTTKQVHIINSSDPVADGLEYSLDGGTTWNGLAPYGDVAEEVAVASIQLRRIAGAANPTYEINAVLQGS